MNAKVILTALHGLPPGTMFVFTGPARCVLGRAKDCEFHVPNDDSHRTVSRHHCELAAKPPHLWVRDLGSMNGTYVNTVNIGWHKPEGSLTPPRTAPYCGVRELEDGDAIQAGNVLLAVHVLEDRDELPPRDTDVAHGADVRRCVRGNPLE
jgi:pSer/pThr/pTyr-binding forkhead associated (FHA) protein